MPTGSAAAAVVTMCALAGCLAGQFPDPPRSAGATLRTASESDAGIVNPLRGLYTWYGDNTAPQPRLPYDAYTRYGWRTLEPRGGRFDFAVIERDLEQAERDGQKLGFRVMAVNEWEGETQVPDDLRAIAGGRVCNGAFVPNWEHPAFVARARALLTELGRRYDGDRRVAYVDIGVYGHWGEWHTWGLCGNEDEASFATKRAIVDAHVAAFRQTRLLMVSGGVETDAFVYALGLSPRIGVRCDSLGDPWFDEQFTRNPRKLAAMRDRWKTAPFVAEFIGPPRVSMALTVRQVADWHVAMISNGNAGSWGALPQDERDAFLAAGRRSGYQFVLADATIPERAHAGASLPIRLRWRNDGVTPAYEPWRVELTLRRTGDGEAVSSARSSIDLQQLLPGVVAETADALVVPADAQPGEYVLDATVADPTGYRRPLRLAAPAADAAGLVMLGRVLLVR